MDLLDNIIQPYAWGSRTAIAALLGQPPSVTPQAELWLGAHPVAPSKSRRDGHWRSLLERVAAAPERELGPEVARRFGRLPFLLKVLAADEPLSLQAHPSLEQARAGFAREQAAGLALDSPLRSYRDDNHKPELLVALTPVEALCGFRDPARTRALFEALEVPALASARAILSEWPETRGVYAVFFGLMSMPEGERAEVLSQVLAAARRHAAARGPFAAECTWACELGRRWPGDVGAVSALMLNLVTLQPGEGLYLPAGNLHAYLRGVGVEVMASSDNVLRGGLTSKHVDVTELLTVLDFTPGPAAVLRAHDESGEAVYATPTAEFRLSRLTVQRQSPLTPARRGPELLLCTEGQLDASGLALGKGSSAFVPASDGPYTLTGDGTAWRATVG